MSLYIILANSAVTQGAQAQVSLYIILANSAVTQGARAQVV